MCTSGRKHDRGVRERLGRRGRSFGEVSRVAAVRVIRPRQFPAGRLVVGVPAGYPVRGRTDLPGDFPPPEPNHDRVLVAEAIEAGRRDDLAGEQSSRPRPGYEQAVAVVGDLRGIRPTEGLRRRKSGVGLLPAMRAFPSTRIRDTLR